MNPPLARNVQQLHRRLHVLAGEGRVAHKDCFGRSAGCEVVKHDRDHDARALDANPPVTDVGTRGDAVAPVHALMIAGSREAS